MIAHTDIKEYENADDFLMDKMKYVPAGHTYRGSGFETVGASKHSCINWLKDNRSIVQLYFTYMDMESKNED